MRIVDYIEQGYDGKGYVIHGLRPPYGSYDSRDPVVVQTFDEVIAMLRKAANEEEPGK